ncbi:MAG: aminopeptidase P family N-terminal domain-containing protein, partial [Dongiaceae bacterium]
MANSSRSTAGGAGKAGTAKGRGAIRSIADLPDLKIIHNGERVKGTFSAMEMASRLSKLRRLMADQDIDHVLFTSYHNINYYSDFLYCSFGRPYGLVVTQRKATTISANIDAGQPWRRTVGENLVYTDWRRDNYFRAIQKLIKDGGKVGIEFDHLNLQNMKKLKSALPGSKLVDIAPATMRMRMIKSKEEIVIIKHGARIADIGGAACVEAIAEGVPEHEVALNSTRAMVREIARTFPHAELMDTWTWFQSGINTDGAHNPVTARRLQKGDILSLNCFPMIAGYYTALERTLFLDHASDAHLRYWQINA